jgi:hypothetical protein
MAAQSSFNLVIKYNNLYVFDCTLELAQTNANGRQLRWGLGARGVLGADLGHMVLGILIV